MRHRILLAALSIAAFAAAPVQAQSASSMAPPASARAAAPSTVEAGGYTYPTEETIGGQPVELNGTGVRKMAFFKVYSMGMYLPHRTTSATEAVQMIEPPPRSFITGPACLIARNGPIRLTRNISCQSSTLCS